MFGSEIIFEPDPSRLELLEDVDALDDFVHLSLNVLSVLDFDMMVSEANVGWLEGEPVRYDEDEGVMLGKVRREGLREVLNFQGEFDEDDVDPEAAREDLENLRQFIAEHGEDHIYEFTAF